MISLVSILESVDRKPVVFVNGGRSFTGSAAWQMWKRWADLNRKDEFLYKVLTTIKNQNYMASPKQQNVLNKWFTSKR
jgi:hypothetical protein